MAGYKVGGGLEGAATALLDIAQRNRTKQDEEEKEFRAFRQKRIEATYAAALEGKIPGIQMNPEATTALLEGRSFSGSPFTARPAFDPSTLGPGERATMPIAGGGTRTYAGPAAPARPGDPYLQATREASLMRSIQEMEQANALAPLIAEKERMAAGTPRPWYKGGGMNYPPAAPVPTMDVAPLRQRLGQLQRLQVGAVVDESQASQAPEGTVLEDPATGEQFEVRNGQLVPIR